MAEIGKKCTLPILDIGEAGIYLDGGEIGEVLLPARHAPDSCSIGDELDVFVYLDSEDYPAASLQQPYAEVGQCAFLKVVSVTDVGAFIDWGLPKDLLVPFSEQKVPFEEGRSYLVYIYCDRITGRIVASGKLDRFLDKKPANYAENQPVELIIANSTDLGYKAIVNHQHWGVLYKNEIFQRLRTGQKQTGYIKKVRRDGKLDLKLQAGGGEQSDELSERILATLKQEGGFSPLSDKSAPDAISAAYGVSKAAYKRAIGGLYKRGLITIERSGITLVK